ncbi:MAG: hypothetical protein ACE37F_21150 [Nannocystaceae bacterium]|nr:hypothetical protein [bacterium]
MRHRGRHLDLSELALPIDPGVDDLAFAGVRTDIPSDLSGTAFVQTVVIEVAQLPQATAGLSINDEIFDNENSLGVVVLDGSLRVERFEDGMVEFLAQEAFDPASFPLTLEIFVSAGEVTFAASGGALRTELITTAVPPWFSDAYVSLAVGNPTPDDPLGTPRFDRLEVCPALDPG